MVSEKQSVLLVAAMTVVLLAGAVTLPSSGIRPYSNAAILKQVALEDTAFCAKFGFTDANPRSAECMTELGDLRQRHERLLIAHDLF